MQSLLTTSNGSSSGNVEKKKQFPFLVVVKLEHGGRNPRTLLQTLEIKSQLGSLKCDCETVSFFLFFVLFEIAHNIGLANSKYSESTTNLLFINCVSAFLACFQFDSQCFVYDEIFQSKHTIK